MKKVILIFYVIIIMSLLFCVSKVYAGDVDNIITKMEGTSTITDADAGSGIASSINDVIGLLQIAGTGISLVTVMILGIKYMLASPSEKADTKKQIMPILIGCVLVFGAVNLVASMADLSTVIKA